MNYAESNWKVFLVSAKSVSDEFRTVIKTTSEF